MSVLVFKDPTPSETNPPPSITTSTAIIHSIYDPSSIPPKPSEGNWTRFVCISDTHQHVFPVPDGDVLLHSGDLTGTGTLRGFKITMDWLYGLTHPLKIIIAGNHDLTLHEPWYETSFYRWHQSKENTTAIRDLVSGEAARRAGVVYLEGETYDFQTHDDGRIWTVYGSPWSPDFFNWAFNYDRGQDADELVAKFPKTDILLTHGPPHEILDKVSDGLSVGCESLRARLPELRPRLHVFGHIHEDHGVQVGEWASASDLESSTSGQTTDLDGGTERTVFVNAANWPAGRRIQTGERIPFAGRGFQPVIVDLRDDP
ncbi:hypothetical protein HETIRDRAFT_472645 [Heterobasidion irregulare TC 32-1]|uniref:Calcineurin-like phosphoesterase domain-containing protein n=1 Tax=Heterobasidion irregulare (strain TC 32-1) TaxID=747525 RepID=W4KED0_HETIT|nr:uncharacterized protein HETIRDRAFT_472645 [Heterobasidion irregulare TC 32-1]ETW84173.1 hypothetical protein HETIRDRAFT_472645 [Heterobasidion irregulare TC 32-1]